MTHVSDSPLPRTHNAEPGKSYQWDAENRLKSLNGGGGSNPEYLYDAEGRRIKKKVGSAETYYFYGLDGRVAAEKAPPGPTGTTTVEYLYFAGRMIAQYKSGGTQFAHADHLGSTRVMTPYPYTGAVGESVDYLPFGEQISGGSTTSHKFTGHERDSETGLDYMGARYYTSLAGRFMSPDLPFIDQNLGNPQSWNLYLYGRNNPLRFADPTGYAAEAHYCDIARCQEMEGGDGGTDALTGSEFGTGSDKGPEELSKEAVKKIIETVQKMMANADLFTSAVTIFNSLGANATVTGQTLRAALTESKVSLDPAVEGMLSKADRITKQDKKVTITSTEGSETNVNGFTVKTSKTVTFEVGFDNKLPQMGKISGVKVDTGKVDVTLTTLRIIDKGDAYSLKADGHLRFGIPLPETEILKFPKPKPKP